MTEDFNPPNYRVEIRWRESEFNYPNLKKCPSLDYAYRIVHEIWHALGLGYGGCYQYCKFNMDPEDERFTTVDIILSYNVYRSPDDNFLRELDITALRTMWSLEKSN